MTFRILVDGDEVFSTDDQILRASVMTGRGEAAAVGLNNEGAIDIQLTRVHAGGPVRLDHLDAFADAQQRARAQDRTTGDAPAEVPRDLLLRQGISPVTAVPPGVEVPGPQPTGAVGPDEDLAEGLDVDDTEGRTAAVNKFTNRDQDSTDSGTVGNGQAGTTPAVGTGVGAGAGTESDFNL